MRDLPVRVVVAGVITVIGLAVLAVAALRGGGEDPAAPTTTVADDVTSTTVRPAPTTIEVLPDWYRKGNSRFSERGPAPTVSSLPPTSTTSTTSVPAARGG